MTTSESNKIFATFKGWTVCECDTCRQKKSTQYKWGERNWEVYAVEDLKFHSSWDWLMPVVEKIESLADIVEIKGIQCLIITFDGIDHVIAKTEKTKLASVYSACLAFIQWYNEQTKS